MITNYLLLLIPVVIWGSNFVVGSWLVGYFHPLILAAIRILFTSSFLLGFAFFTHRFVRIKKKQWVYLLLIGFIGTMLNQTFFFQALNYTNATESALIMSLAPICTSIMGYFFLREPLTVRMMVGSVIAVFGVYMLVLFGKQQLSIGLGDLLAAGAMLTFSISLILIRKLSQTLGAMSTTVYSTILGACMFVPFVYVNEQHIIIAHSFWPWILAALSGILSQGVGGLIWNRGISKIGASKASILLNLQPFVAMIVGYIALGLPITQSQLTGGILIVFGVIVATFQLQALKKEKQISA
ncbi:DMT family transporter [Aneurinibacillus sp. Ricciae_BoGa-3]|uniref:DMT family transporter n=1 Tax=Aneurinibacillus sp. Ricciae_BoGa-3 TaxID=3022697 RepID=UPI00233FA21E|nr:DMT family transporter [Aneurinibacillus sp. Ricciae_BoGa-3]WCK56641.1 DMT family transporter [Aneurinibacillus sp. Ricciae_BoGa-3]